MERITIDRVLSFEEILKLTDVDRIVPLNVGKEFRDRHVQFLIRKQRPLSNKPRIKWIPKLLSRPGHWVCTGWITSRLQHLSVPGRTPAEAWELYNRILIVYKVKPE